MNIRIFPFLLCPIGAIACDGERLDVVAHESRLTFTVMQGDAPFSGRFREMGGFICHSGDGSGAIQVQSIRVWMNPASIDSGLPEVDALLIEPEFFRIEQYPRVTFESESVQQQGMHVRVIGRLVINGIARQRDITFRMTRLNDDRWQASGEFSVMRLEHELGRGEWDNTDYLDNEVDVAFNAILVPAEERKE